MNMPELVKRHLAALGVGDAGLTLVEREVERAIRMNRDELQKAVELKTDAIRLLLIQQAVYLAALEEGAPR